MKYLLGKKLGMTTLYDEGKGALNVTLLSCEINEVTIVRNKERDGYQAVQMEVPVKKNFFRKEFRIQEKEAISVEVGAKMDVSIFEVGDEVSVSGITKAKGFQGVVKRHGFKGSPKTHGRKHDWRAPGSIGASFPEHVFKGKRMGGRMGGTRSTMKGLDVVFIDSTKGLLAVRGAVPGKIGSIVEIVSK
ncbi:MAG: 50S ribosomal protein L3 [Candidatus Moraniibacteriota bacterium]|nr:MAG: 50S ribosomal protein L3 [Candidatus Moranbacteria bacterium]